MEEAVPFLSVSPVGTFEVDLQAGELRKGGREAETHRPALSGPDDPAGAAREVVTREELQKRLWPDTFVDVDHNLNTAINKIREVLGDSAESPRFVETLASAWLSLHRAGRRCPDCRRCLAARRAAGIAKAVGRRPRCDLVVVLVLLAAAGLFIYTRLQAPASACPADAYPPHFRRRSANRSHLVAGRPLHRLQFQPWWQIRHLGAAGQRRRSGADHEGSRSKLATGLVARRQVSLPIVPKTAKVVCSSCPRSVAKDWKEELRLSDITLAGLRTAHRSCSRPILRVVLLTQSSTTSTWLVSMEAHRVKCLPILFRTKLHSMRVQPPGIRMARGSRCGREGMGLVQISGQYRLRRASRSNRKSPRRLQESWQKHRLAPGRTRRGAISNSRGRLRECHLLRADVSRSHEHLAHEHRSLHIEGRGNRADDHGPRARCGTIPLLRWKEAGLHRAKSGKSERGCFRSTPTGAAFLGRAKR